VAGSAKATSGSGRKAVYPSMDLKLTYGSASVTWNVRSSSRFRPDSLPTFGVVPAPAGFRAAYPWILLKK